MFSLFLQSILNHVFQTRVNKYTSHKKGNNQRPHPQVHFNPSETEESCPLQPEFGKGNIWHHASPGAALRRWSCVYWSPCRSASFSPHRSCAAFCALQQKDAGESKLARYHKGFSLLFVLSSALTNCLWNLRISLWESLDVPYWVWRTSADSVRPFDYRSLLWIQPQGSHQPPLQKCCGILTVGPPISHCCICF